jgi:hypothetical protein
MMKVNFFLNEIEFIILIIKFKLNRKQVMKIYFYFYFLLRSFSQATKNVCVSGTGQVSIQYEKLKFPIAYFFAIGKSSLNTKKSRFFSLILSGSPIAMFLTVRGVTSLASDYTLPTCLGLFNIFHPVCSDRKNDFFSLT